MTKLNLTTMQDAGLFAENRLQKLRRAVGELPSDWIVRFDKSEKELTEQLQVVDKGVTNIICPHLRTCWFLRCSGLTAKELRDLVSATGGTYDYDQVAQYVMNKYPADAISENDKVRGFRGTRGRDKTYFETEGES